jgi:hypothetical protein
VLECPLKEVSDGGKYHLQVHNFTILSGPKISKAFETPTIRRNFANYTVL